MIVHDEWKVLRLWWHTVVSPEFVDVDINVIRHLEEAFKQMINHAAKSTDSQRAVGGGVNVDVEWVGVENNLCTLRVYPRSNKYVVTIERDELRNVMITFPRMSFTNDIPGLNQARHICGQVVQIARSMGRV